MVYIIIYQTYPIPIPMAGPFHPKAKDPRRRNTSWHLGNAMNSSGTRGWTERSRTCIKMYQIYQLYSYMCHAWIPYAIEIINFIASFPTKNYDFP